MNSGRRGIAPSTAAAIIIIVIVGSSLVYFVSTGTLVASASAKSSTISGDHSETTTPESTGPSPQHFRVTKLAQAVGRATALAVDSVRNRIYVVNEFSDSITVLDGSTNSAIKTIGVGHLPVRIAVDARTNMIYVENFGGSVSVIDGSSNTVVAEVAVGAGPVDIAVDPTTNHVYVVYQGLGNLTVIDGGKNKIVSNIHLGPYYQEVTVDPLLGRAYAYSSEQCSATSGGGQTCSTSSGVLTAIDDKTMKILTNTTVGGLGTDLAIDSATHTVFVPSCFGPIDVVDGTTNKIVSTIGWDDCGDLAVNPSLNSVYVPSGGALAVVDEKTYRSVANVTGAFGAGERYVPLAVNTANGLVYVLDENRGIISVLDGSSNKIQGSVSGWWGSPSALAYDPVTKLLYVGYESSDVISILSPSSGRWVGNVTLGLTPSSSSSLVGTSGIAIDSITGKAYAAYSGVLSVLDMKTESVVSTIPIGGSLDGVAVDPGANRIYVTNYDTGTLSVVDGSSNHIVANIPTGNASSGLTVNPSNHMVYVIGGNSRVVNNSVMDFGTLWVIDGSSDMVVKQVAIGGVPGGLAVDPTMGSI